MAKFDYLESEAGYNSREKLNENFNRAQQAFENTLSRDGTTPNEMLANLDMNSRRVINLGPAASPTEAPNLGQVQSLVESIGDVEAFSNAFITPQMFGAVGDGVADDRPAIQAALDYAFSLGGATVYFPPVSNFYAIKSEHPDYPGHGLILKKVGNFRGDYTIKGNLQSSQIRLDTDSNITSLFYWPERISQTTITNMWFDANNKADHVLKADEEYCPNIVMTSVYFRNGLTEIVRLSTFLSTFTQCNTFRGTVGFRFLGVGGGPVTSITMNSCYALQATDCGYDFGFTTYCTLNACAVDGSIAGGFNTEIGYRFANAFGVTMNSCGSEQVKRFLKCTSYRGFVLNAPYILLAGGDTAPVDYLIEFVSGRDATVSGIRSENPTAEGFTYLLAQTGSSFGDENITVTDRSATRSNSFWVQNFSFQRPIKFLRDDSTRKIETVNFSDAATLRTRIFSISGREYEYGHDIIWQLADGTYDLEVLNPFLRNISGSGSLTIQGNPNNNQAVKLLSSFNQFGFINCNIKIVVKNLTIGGTIAGGSTYRLFAENSPNVILDNVRILRDNVNLGHAMRVRNGSKVQLINGTVALGTTIGATWLIDASSEVIIQPATAAPSTGRWTRGMRLYHSQPATAGNIGFVCTSPGEPGTWRTFGTISS